LKARTPEAASVAAQARLKSRPAVVGTVGATVSPQIAARVVVRLPARSVAVTETVLEKVEAALKA
jgi:hypothetical protein